MGEEGWAGLGWPSPPAPLPPLLLIWLERCPHLQVLREVEEERGQVVEQRKLSQERHLPPSLQHAGLTQGLR